MGINLKLKHKQQFLKALVVVSLAYFVTAMMSVYWTENLKNISEIWLANAVSLSILLKMRKRFVVPCLFVVSFLSFLTGLLYGLQKEVALVFSVANIVEVVAAYAILKNENFNQHVISRVQTGFKVILAVIVSCFISTAIVAIWLYATKEPQWVSFSWNWWMTDSMAMLIVLPIALSVTYAEIKNLFQKRILLEFLGSTILVCLTMYLSLSYAQFPFIFIILPFLAVAVRLGFFKTALISLLMMLLLVVLEWKQFHFYAISFDTSYSRNSLRLFTALSILPSLLIALLIDQRRVSEAALLSEKERLDITLKSIGDGVIVTDEKMRVRFINPIAKQILEVDDEVLGKHVDDVLVLLNEETLAPIVNPIKTCLAEKKVVHLHEATVLINHNKKRYNIQDSAAPIISPTSEIEGAILVFQNVSEKRKMEIKIKYQATHDSLTGMLNRREFELMMKNLLNAPGIKRQHSLCFIDLDRFKIVNDTAGHAAGDILLCEVSQLLKTAVRGSDVISRIGGDEFGLLLTECSSVDAKNIAENIIKMVNSTRFAWEGKIYEVGVSIGVVSFFSDENTTVESLLAKSDVACYTAKNQGRNRVAVYSEGDTDITQVNSEIQIAAEIGQAIKENRFMLCAQEIRPLDKNTHFEPHFEILIRMIGKNGETILPANFIPAAERYDLIMQIDQWVVKKLLLEQDELIAKLSQFKIAINLSVNSIKDAAFIDFLTDALKKTAIPRARISFEITETAIVNNLTKTGEFVRLLQSYGCTIALDDFGTGFSSFNYLKHCPVDFVKIDGSFVAGIDRSLIDRTIVESVNYVAHQFKAKTIAENVESMAVAGVLQEMGVDYAQGIAIGKPIPLDDILAVKTDRE